MSVTSELQAVGTTVSAGDLPPPPPLPGGVAVVPPNQINQAPMLPRVAPLVPGPATATANPFASSMEAQWMPAGAAPKRAKSGKLRRTFSWLVVLAVLGGLAYVGVRYGSDLVELATGDDAVDEAEAPMDFPLVSPVPIRTATYTVERVDPVQGTQTYEVTTDFEIGVSRVVLDRSGERPDLEVLTVGDQALIRRIDQPIWYRLNRGAFPIGTELGRARWIRTIDELVPPAVRDGVTIERSTESAVGTLPTRRLLLTVDPSRLIEATTAVVPPAPVEGTAAAPLPMPVVLPPGVVLQSGTDPVETLSVEIWVDGAGIVRKSIMPPALGGETVTITSLSGDPWQPPFPAEETIQPLTAAALFDLGL
jgi:hypothetical protein